MIVLKSVLGVVLAAVLLLVGFVGDMTLNGSRVFYLAIGRDRLVRDCTPLLKEHLVGKGFSPTDLIFGEHPSIAFASGAFGQGKTLADDFTFSDGPNGQRVDGSLICAVSGKTVKVDVSVDSLPMRVTVLAGGRVGAA